MNSDATEAALGLLGLSPFNAPQSHPQPQPHSRHHVVHAHGPSLTSTSVGIAIDRTSAPPIIQSALPPSLVPLKRKQPSPALSTPTPTPLTPSSTRDVLSTKPRQPSHPLASSSTPPPSQANRPLPNVSTKPPTAPSQQHPQQRPFSPSLTSSALPQTPPVSQLPPPSPSTSQHPLTLSDVPPPPDSEAISCICGFTYDDGFSIACDDCSRWCHAACFGIVQGEVPEFWKCWICDPALVIDKERAGKIQKGRQKTMRTKASHGANGGVPGVVNGVGGNPAVDERSGASGKPASRRKTSPGAERKSRRGSAVAAAIEGSGSSRKKRRASILSPVNPSSPSILAPNPSIQAQTNSSRISYPNGNGPSTSSTLPPTPVKFPPDIYPNPSIYSQLLRVAKAWRGVTALNPPSPLTHPPPKTYNDGDYIRVDSQGYQDRYGYSMCPLDNTTPVILDENVGKAYVPRTVLRTDPPMPCSFQHSGLNSHYPPSCTPAHLRPPSPRLHVAPDPSPLPHSIYPSPPVSNYASTPVPSSLHQRPCAKSPLSPSTNTISSSNPNNRVPASTLLAPYTATVVPSAAYLADPLNGYAHLGMGKPQVRLVGGGWEVGLDARSVGGVPDLSDSGEKGNRLGVGKEDAEDGKARWARCGCWPNAVVRPVICAGTKKGERKQGMRMRHRAECAEVASDSNTISKDGDPPRAINCSSVPPVLRTQAQQMDDSSEQDNAPSLPDSDPDPTTLSFGLFALRDLRADEEIVLGWEWDDGHAVHMLPALIESPGIFAPAHLHHLRAQFTSILHALSSTFTTCACGSSTRDCAVRVMERVVEGRWPWPGGEAASEGSEGESSDGASGEYEDCEEDVDVEGNGHVDLRTSRNWGLGVNVDMDIEMNVSVDVDRPPRRAKKRRMRKSGQGDDKLQTEGCRDASAAVPPVKQRSREQIDLGPLVGVKRGFRTREKAPMNGGWGGVEIVPSSLSAFPEVKTDEFHPDGKGKGKVWTADDQSDVEVNPSVSTLPPRIRKAWPRSLASQTESSQDLPRAHSNRAESWRAHERWRSPDADAESPRSVFGVAEASSVRDVDLRQGSVSMNGDGEDGADGQETETDTETEADGLDDTRQMPPPPMPASLDPTTISSLAHAHAVRSVSPRGSIQWDKNITSAALIPSRTPTPTSASSGRSSQPPSQGTSTSSTPVPANSTVLRLVPSRVTLSSSTSLSNATQAQAQSHPPTQSHPPPLVASISPSAPFSKLSLHSPDTASSPHLSVLFTSGESTPSFSAPASIQHIPDHRISSSPPLPHRPSKPLHVHPQNEPPTLSASLSAPAVTLKPPDSMRETPAEAQYQQPYESSPDSRHDSPQPDAEKKRPPNGEVYRVRFASPEILSGLPRLAGKVTDKSELPGTDDDAATKGDAIRVVKEQAGPTINHDAMDVDVDVVGDDQGNGVFCPPHVVLPESSVNHEPEDAPDSPHPQVSLDSLSHDIPAVVDGAVPENGLSQVAPDVNERTLEAELMAVDPDPVEPVREPSPPPPPKVKMSLKDFALRKKKQREEEMVAKAFRSPETPDGPGLLSSPIDDVKQDFANEQTNGVQATESDKAINGHRVKVNDAVQDDGASPGALHGSVNGLDGDKGQGHDVGRDSGRREEKKATEVDCNVPAETPSACTSLAKGSDNTQSAQPPPSSTTSSHAPEKRNYMDRTQTLVDSKPPATLMAKMEIMDAILPNGLVGADDRMPDVVSFAPDPPPPPLTIKQTGETTPIDRTVPITPSASAPASLSTSSSTSVVNSRSNSVGVTSNSNPLPALSSNIPISRRPSHEDGEITSSTPPKTYLPHSHTPPTQPRSFHAVHPSPSIGSTPSSTTPASRRPAPPLSRSPLSNAAGPTPPPISSRPLPSGPRALRGTMSQPTHPPSYASPRPPYVASQYIPRGPSADRDRMDWERGDRQWAAQARTRGRAGSNGWGR